MPKKSLLQLSLRAQKVLLDHCLGRPGPTHSTRPGDVIYVCIDASVMVKSPSLLNRAGKFKNPARLSVVPHVVKQVSRHQVKIWSGWVKSWVVIHRPSAGLQRTIDSLLGVAEYVLDQHGVAR